MTETEIKAETEAEIARTSAALVSKARKLENSLSRTVDPIERTREHPWQMVAIAFGAGFVFGWFG